VRKALERESRCQHATAVERGQLVRATHGLTVDDDLRDREPAGELEKASAKARISVAADLLEVGAVATKASPCPLAMEASSQRVNRHLSRLAAHDPSTREGDGRFDPTTRIHRVGTHRGLRIAHHPGGLTHRQPIRDVNILYMPTPWSWWVSHRISSA